MLKTSINTTEITLNKVMQQVKQQCKGSEDYVPSEKYPTLETRKLQELIRENPSDEKALIDCAVESAALHLIRETLDQIIVPHIEKGVIEQSLFPDNKVSHSVNLSATIKLSSGFGQCSEQAAVTMVELIQKGIFPVYSSCVGDLSSGKNSHSIMIVKGDFTRPNLTQTQIETETNAYVVDSFLSIVCPLKDYLSNPKVSSYLKSIQCKPVISLHFKLTEEIAKRNINFIQHEKQVDFLCHQIDQLAIARYKMTMKALFTRMKDNDFPESEIKAAELNAQKDILAENPLQSLMRQFTKLQLSYQNRKAQLLTVKALLDDVINEIHPQQWKVTENNDSVKFWLLGDEKRLKLIQEHLGQHHIEAQLRFTADKREPLLLINELVASELLNKIPKLHNSDNSLATIPK